MSKAVVVQPAATTADGNVWPTFPSARQPRSQAPLGRRSLPTRRPDKRIQKNYRQGLRSVDALSGETNASAKMDTLFATG